MLLIVTSCIKPVRQKHLLLNDPQVRYDSTIKALFKIIDSGIFNKIVICDSSNYKFNEKELNSYASPKGIQMEYLYFEGNGKLVQEKGKGYGEGEIMNYVISNSSLLKYEDYFFKLTGKLYIENIQSIASKFKKNRNYFNITTLKFLGSIDTRFYGISKDDYIKGLLHAYEYVDDRNFKWYEVCFRDFLKRNEIKFYQFPELPIVRGLSGTNGEDKFKRNLFYYYQVFLTKLGFHNSFLGALSSYVILKITLIIKSE